MGFVWCFGFTIGYSVLTLGFVWVILVFICLKLVFYCGEYKKERGIGG